jgi:hypothetical protein
MKKKIITICFLIVFLTTSVSAASVLNVETVNKKKIGGLD